jgi:DNA-binding MarR family transcriptional regulator
VLVARLMRLFENRGWVLRRPDPSDGRASFVELTETGREKLRGSWGTLHQAMGSFFDPLGREEKGFRRLLTQLLKAHDPDRELAKSVRARREERRKKRKG